MLDGFEKETKPLTDYESDVLLPVMQKCLSRHIGEDKAVKNCQICEALEKKGYSVNEARIRKLINHIRINGLVDCLVATSKGYFVAESTSEMRSHISSLIGREGAIRAVRLALEKQLEDMKDEQKILS